MKPFLIRWLCSSVAVAVAVYLTPMQASGLTALICTALLLGIVNAFIRPVLLLLSLPFILVTLGFFILVVNALMLKLVSGIVPGFDAGGFWSAFFGAIIISLTSWLLSLFFRSSDGRVHTITHHPSIKKAKARLVQ